MAEKQLLTREDGVGLFRRQPFQGRCTLRHASDVDVEKANTIEDRKRRGPDPNAAMGELLQQGLSLGANALRIGKTAIGESHCERAYRDGDEHHQPGYPSSS